MRISRGQTLTEKKVIFKEERHCIHSEIVKKKQSSRIIKKGNSHHSCNINCKAKMLMCIE